MEVFVAGYNIDADILKEIEEKTGKRDDLTPEVLSAAYARISRDARPINEIRKDARGEVEQARKSNSTIIFRMGHHSVAEHAVFNLDFIGISRLAMEEVERFRLCSYTEKSQRYITLDKEFVIPGEIKGTQWEGKFIDIILKQNKAYSLLFEELKKYLFNKHRDILNSPKGRSLLEGWAKEDARYVTSLSAHSQVGITVNARNLELMIRRFASSACSEVKALGKLVYERISSIAPSVIIFHQANDRDLKTYPELNELSRRILSNGCLIPADDQDNTVKLVEYTRDADNIIASSLLHTSSELSYEQFKSIAGNLSQDEKRKVFETAFKNMQFYDTMLREFEYVNLTFNLILSAACFGQFKRHRMATITQQPYNPQLGITVPESIKEIGMDTCFKEIIDETSRFYNELKKINPLAAAYILTNAHRRRVLVRINARELYHISRLREDAHAQWDIRNISRMMSAKAKEAMPLVFSLIGPKDEYNDIYKDFFGELPKVTEAVLPGARKIK
ncbi:MAG: FAD-dependent thymidylate synthase [Candidatus Omnitrophota bacterium]